MGLLRLFLAVVVFNAHASNVHVHIGPQWLSPFMAVRIFYIISGFYMAMVIAETYSRTPNGTRRFYLNRVVRLYPVYLLVFLGALTLQLSGNLATTVPYLWTGSQTYIGAISFGYSLTGIINDLFLFPAALQLAIYNVSLRPPLSAEMLVTPCFTVGVECIFYALAPAIVTRSLPLLIGLFAFAFGLHAAPALMGLPPRPLQYDFFPGVLVFFVAGVLSYRTFAWLRIQKLPLWIKRPTLLLDFLSRQRFWLTHAAVVAIAAATLRYLPWQESGTNTWASALYYVGAAVLTPLFFVITSRSKLDRFLGDLSYPLYVVHFPVLIWAAGLEINDHHARSALVILIVAALTLFLTVFVERPLQLLRSRNRERTDLRH